MDNVGQNGILPGQKFHSPVMSTSHTDTTKNSPVNLRFCLFVKIQSCSVIENYTRISSLFSHCFPGVLTVLKKRLDRAKISLLGDHVRPPSKNYFKP